jgi:hypothetical protein
VDSSPSPARERAPERPPARAASWTAAAAAAVAAALIVSSIGGGSLDGRRSWAVLIGTLVVVIALTASAIAGRRSDYDGPSDRDLRIDMLRGLAIVFVVVNHLDMPSLFQNVTQEAIGPVSGAELFVLLSGVVLGMAYRPKVVSGGIGEVVIRATGRARRLYTAAITVVVLVFLASHVPFIDGDAVTTFIGEGTGAGGSGDAGRVYDLYPGTETLFDYPADPQVIVDIALLRIGPWQFNVMGLYVLLLLLTPLVLWCLSRRWWPGTLAVSAALYALGTVSRIRALPSQFEFSFPFLVWQLLFVAGLVGGYHRREILDWFRTGAGRYALVAIILLATLFAAFSWNNPYLSSALDARIALIPDGAYRDAYGAFFGRTFLEAGRLLDVFLVTIALYAALTAYWRPLNRAVGWFLVPLGQASLYVFILHVFLVLAVSNIPALQAGDAWIDTVAYVVILGLIWVMVRTRFLFRLIPR